MKKLSPNSLANLVKVKKGQVLNPEGGRSHDPQIRAIKRLTQQELAEVGALVVKGSIAELQKISKDPNASALKCMIAAVAHRTITRGDPTALDKLLDRLVGKVKEQIEVTGADGGPQVIVSLPGKNVSNQD